jgi:hypothetical protein
MKNQKGFKCCHGNYATVTKFHMKDTEASLESIESIDCEKKVKKA